MISDKLQAIVNELNKQGKMVYKEGATEDQISKFEKDYDIVFPSDFREWLKFSDGGLLYLPAGIQLYGVASKPSIDINEADRPDDSYVVIGVLATGDPILCKRCSDQISIYNHETSKIEDDEKFDNFFSFLKALYALLGLED